MPLETPEELRALLHDHGATDLPHEGDPHRLQGALALALHLAERQKQVDFVPFTWDDPRFLARDAKVDMTLLLATLHGRGVDDLQRALHEALARPHGARTLVALDARASGITEFELGHHLYGEVTLFSYPHRPPAPADGRIEEARERGWIRTLKEHNLLPGRGIVVLDEHHGLFLTDPRMRELEGVLALLPTNHVTLLLNPFAREALNDPELEHWLAWGGGAGGATEWRVLLEAGPEGEDLR